MYIFKNIFLHIVPVAGNGKDVLNGGSYLGKTFQSLMWTLVEVNLFILNNHLSVFQTKKKSWLCCFKSWTIFILDSYVVISISDKQPDLGWPKLHPTGLIFWTMIFYNLKKFRSRSNEGSNFIWVHKNLVIELLKHSHFLTNYQKLQIWASHNT